MIETVAGLTELQIKFFTACAQTLVAIAVGGIAWRQWRTAVQQAETARNKLIADLFDRRYKIYSRFRELVQTAMVGRQKEMDHALIEISMLKHEMRWVFGNEVVQKLDEQVISTLTPMALARTNMQSSEGEQYRQHTADYRAARDRADASTRFIPKIFEDSLTLRH
ncbi:hypothetical protein [Stenotrophomonas maltophilia]|nr:hypothetical protein [Stenotrophomonas maltophilia]MBA0361068.1 hypothetical protein [Stenotrophomonas maltophilia]CCP16105.1 hypothetical protein predicted by Glimmer/Critica [Stenotrophomonas maltophilia RA8]HEL5042979.1 hypothetical protein [Stenotrophomonas maltophilia]